MRNRFIGFTLIALLIAFGSVVAFAAPVEISYWGVWGGEPAQSIENDVINAFNEAFEGRYRVVGSPAVSPEQLTTAVIGGAPPDVVKVDRFEVGSYASANVITPLDDLIARDGFSLAEYYPATSDEAFYQGQTYAIPWNTDNRALYYNISMFAEAGLDPNAPPTTWEQVDEYARVLDRWNPDGTLAQGGFVPHWGNWYFLGWLWAAGGEVLSEDNRTVAWNGPEGHRAINWMKEALDKYGGAPELDAWSGSVTNGAFYGGRLGMMMDGSWALGHIKNIGMEGQFGVANPPRPAGLEHEPITWSGGFALAIPVGVSEEKRRGAWEFIKFYTSHWAQTQLGSRSGQIPAMRSAATSEEFMSIDPLIYKFVDLMSYSRFRPVIPAGTQMWRIYVDQVHSLLTGGDTPPEQIMLQTAENGQQALDEGWMRAGL